MQVGIDPGLPVDGASGREIRAFDVLHQLPDSDIRLVNLGTNAIYDLAQIMRRHIGRHAHRDAGAAIDDEVGKGGGKNGGLSQALVIVRDKIDGVLVHILHEEAAEMGEAGFRITHGCGRIAIHRAEIPLPVHQGLPDPPMLGHIHQGRINH